MQLNLFSTDEGLGVAPAGSNALVSGSAERHGGHYVMLTGIRERNFVAYNVDAYTLNDDAVTDDDILILKYKEATPIIQRLKSETWSCDCEWFFVVQDDGIYLMSVSSVRVFMCKKHSIKFVDHFINAPTKLEK